MKWTRNSSFASNDAVPVPFSVESIFSTWWAQFSEIALDYDWFSWKILWQFLPEDNCSEFRCSSILKDLDSFDCYITVPWSGRKQKDSNVPSYGEGSSGDDWCRELYEHELLHTCAYLSRSISFMKERNGRKTRQYMRTPLKQNDKVVRVRHYAEFVGGSCNYGTWWRPSMKRESIGESRQTSLQRQKFSHQQPVNEMTVYDLSPSRKA